MQLARSLVERPCVAIGPQSGPKGETWCLNVATKLGAFPTQDYNRPPRFYIAVHTDADLYAPSPALPA